MGKTAKRLEPTVTHDLTPERTTCLDCGRHLRADYTNHRTTATLTGVTRLNLTIRRCRNERCPAVGTPYRPEAEGRFALPRHEFGFDVLALIGHLRYREHRSVPEIHVHRTTRGVQAAERTVLNLLDRYDELLAVALADDAHLKSVLADQKRVVLAVDGLQPDVGHEVLWVARDCLSGEILAAKAMLSARRKDLIAWLSEVKAACPVAVAGVVSDGQHTIRQAVAAVFPDVPHQLCQFHYLREAAKPIYEADRHAKKELKKKVRGVRRIEGLAGAEAEVVRGYYSAVRSALTDDGRPPLEASGRKLHERLTAIDASQDRVAAKGAADGVDVPEGDGQPGVGGDGPRVADPPSGVRVGASSGSSPGSGGTSGRAGPPAVGRVARCDDPTPRPGRLAGEGG